MFLLLFVYFILMISTSEIGITSSFQYTIHCCFKGDSTEHPGLLVWVLKSITILSATALQILVNRLFAQQIVQAKNKGKHKSTALLALCEEIHRSLTFFPIPSEKARNAERNPMPWRYLLSQSHAMNIMLHWVLCQSAFVLSSYP